MFWGSNSFLIFKLESGKAIQNTKNCHCVFFFILLVFKISFFCTFTKCLITFYFVYLTKSSFKKPKKWFINIYMTFYILNFLVVLNNVRNSFFIQTCRDTGQISTTLITTFVPKPDI